MNCPFCNPDPERVFFRWHDLFCMWDGYPVSEGHALVVLCRHVSSWFDATEEEQQHLLAGIKRAQDEITARYQPDAFNIGVNVGETAGQTVPHLHVHVIPRYRGDVPDPRGGVRHIIPGKGNYQSANHHAAEVAVTYEPIGKRPMIFGSDERPFLDELVRELEGANRLDLAVAFVTVAGVQQLEPYLSDFFERSGQMRLLTGDYLGVTEPRALRKILDWAQEYPDQANARVFQSSAEIGFHPKAYLFHKGYDGSVAFVGSSNLTRHALRHGIEWNQRIERRQDDEILESIGMEFEALYQHGNTVELHQEWIDGYAKRRKVVAPTTTGVGVDLEEEMVDAPPIPHSVQQEALACLLGTRAAGNAAGLVVLATGLGKTWLAAFDSLQFKRVLFVAHREEILKQSLATFRKIRPDSKMGLYLGRQRDDRVDVMFASVQTLSRVRHLSQFRPDQFDYVVIDEFHHAAAATYRRLIDFFDPQFLLGLTATPERTDGGDLLALCGENLVFRCDLADGIHRKLLSRFKYYGIPDDVDFSNIPWRNGRFDPQQVEFAVATERRAENAYEQWRKHGQQRTLGFCVSTRHADFMAEYFHRKGVRVAAVHSGPSSAPRTQTLEQLAAGALQVVFAVDIFNEGVDVPAVDTVLMLRPTESKIVWLQQFGRGLRLAANKEHLSVIDYIGNHRSFLQVPLLLIPSLSDSPGQLHLALSKIKNGYLELPDGCSMQYELEAIDILMQLSAPTSTGNQTAEWYRTFRELQGHRPTAVEAYHSGYDPAGLRQSFGSWFGFVRSEGDLSQGSLEVLQRYEDFFKQLERTPMTKSFKMVVLLAMMAADAFPGAINIKELIPRVATIATRTPGLKEEFGGVLKDQGRMRALLEQNPIRAWVEGRGTGGESFFSYESGEFESFDVEESLSDSFRELSREVCEYRLAKYVGRNSPTDRTSVEPTLQHDDQVSGKPILWREYMRAKIPTLWGLEFKSASWNQGFVRADGNLFLLVSLDKQGMAEEHQYADKFLSPTSFQWMSQNQTRRDQPSGQRIRNHAAEGTAVHLFVRDKRKTPSGTAAPFVYCGQVEFLSWEGDKPITVQWALRDEVPAALWQRFSIPG